MKRSAIVTVGLLTAVAASLMGCDESPPRPDAEVIFSDAEACTKTLGRENASACQNAQSQARDMHLRTAPQFADKVACENEIGAPCQALTGAQPDVGGQINLSQVFIPAMTGYALGQLMGGGMRTALPIYQRQGGERAREEERQGGGTASSGVSYIYSGRQAIGTAPTQGRSRALTPTVAGKGLFNQTAATSSASISRGGIGATGRSFSAGSS
jgi:uncharacterized protein YgiB involved in biofilm formation